MLVSFSAERDFVYRVGWNIFNKKKIFADMGYISLFLADKFNVFSLQSCFCRQLLGRFNRKSSRNSFKINRNLVRMLEFLYLFFRLFTSGFVSYIVFFRKRGIFNSNVMYNLKGLTRHVSIFRFLFRKGNLKLKNLTYTMRFDILAPFRKYLIYFFYLMIRFVIVGLRRKSVVLGFDSVLDVKSLNFVCFFNDLGTLVVSSTNFQVLYDYFDWEDNFFFINFNLKALQGWAMVFLSNFRLL